ncbi:hypothetical protein D9M71_757340 [compost metagenome]
MPWNCWRTLSRVSWSAGTLLPLATSSAAMWAVMPPLSDRALYTGSTPTVFSVGLRAKTGSPGAALAAGSIQAVMPRLLL